MRWMLPIFCFVFLCGFAPEADDIAGWRFVRSLPIGASLHGVGTAYDPLPVRAGRSSLRFELRPGDCSRGRHGWDDCQTGRERAELKQTSYQHSGETWWYGFSLFVPKTHQNIWPAKLSFAQFHQEGAKPAVMLQNHTGGLWLDIHNAQGTLRLEPLVSAADLRGRWHDVVLEIHWSRNDDGLLRVWLGDREVAHYRGPTMSAERVYFKFGLYRSHLQRNPTARRTTHVIFFDRVVRSRTHAD